MTKMLTDLITSKTPVLLLKSNPNITDQQKYDVLGIDPCLSSKYLKYMYYYKNRWIYFKKDSTNKQYPFYILDELMGSYLAKQLELPTVSYRIAKANGDYGIASVNFKKRQYRYYTINELIENYLANKRIENIELLKGYAIDDENQQLFLRHLFNLFSLDIFMIQRDRGMLNLQYQIDRKTGSFDIAKVYDYSNCLGTMDLEKIYLYNSLITFNEKNIYRLLRKYPYFKEALCDCLEKSMEETWNQICVDYHFNQDSSIYEKAKIYYKRKDRTQKAYINQILKSDK